MLIEFSVENFLSFHERVTLSMVAAPELEGAKTEPQYFNEFKLKSALAAIVSGG